MQRIQDRYEFDPGKDELGKGGFGRVFKAQDTLLDREVVLKVAEQSHLPERYSLIEEIKRVISFDHPNLTRYYDAIVMNSQNQFGENVEYQIGVMEYVDGGNLGHYLKDNQPPPLDEARSITEGTLKGLAYLHRKGIIHRDIKPPNILLRRDEDSGAVIAKICDFGISKAVGSEATNLSNVIGTFEYMSPEQLGNNPDGKISTNSDFWSLGIMLYEMFAGKLPFGSSRSGLTSAQVIGNILVQDIPTEVENMPEPFKSLIKACLVKQAPERVKEAKELLQILNGQTTRIPSIKPEVPPRKEEAPAPPKKEAPKKESKTPEKPASPVSPPPAKKTDPQPTPELKPSLAEKDKAAWAKVSRINSTKAYEAYLKKYPEGAFVDQAQAQLASLQAPAKSKARHWIPGLWALGFILYGLLSLFLVADNMPQSSGLPLLIVLGLIYGALGVFLFIRQPASRSQLGIAFYWFGFALVVESIIIISWIYATGTEHSLFSPGALGMLSGALMLIRNRAHLSQGAIITYVLGIVLLAIPAMLLFGLH